MVEEEFSMFLSDLDACKHFLRFDHDAAEVKLNLFPRVSTAFYYITLQLLLFFYFLLCFVDFIYIACLSIASDLRAGSLLTM